MSFDLPAIQQGLRDFRFDGWLLYDFRSSNILARRVLGFDDSQHGSRRWFYFVPASGTPVKLVHRIESGALDHLPGDKRIYLRWQELEQEIQSLIADVKRIAMEYSPRISNPYVSRVDAGVIELVRSFGCNVSSSGDLVQLFEATWDDEQWKMHQQAARVTDAAFGVAWRLISEQVNGAGSVLETEVQRAILDHFAANGLTTYSPPIVAANEHSGDPHFETSPDNDARIHEGDFVLIDLWGKLDQPRAVYSDLTRVGFVGGKVPEKYEQIFQIVAAARDAAIALVKTRTASGQELRGWEVDQSARDVIDRAGFGQFFIHRTGHSIGQETHGNGANMDNLETHEERLVMRRTCFSIEPGIYLPEFGVRSETNIFIDAAGQVHVTGGELQRNVLAVSGVSEP